MEHTKITSVASDVINHFVKKSGSNSAVIHHRPVDKDCFEPNRSVLHKGKLIELGQDMRTIAKTHAEQAEIQSALVTLATFQQKPKVFDLSTKEQAYLEMLCEGHSDQDVAQSLSLSLRAIKARKRKICEKTDSATINQAIARYVYMRDAHDAENDEPANGAQPV